MERLLRSFCVLVFLSSALVLLPLRGAVAASPIRVYIFAGQSNMVGAYTAASQLAGEDPSLADPPSHVKLWGPSPDDASRWGPLVAPDVVIQAVSHHGFGPEISAGHALAALHPGQPIAIVKYAWNGTNLYAQWNPKRNGLYRGMVDTVRYSLNKLRAETGLPTRIAGMFWMQGEADSRSWRHATSYGRTLTDLITSARRDFHAPAMPFVIGQIDDLSKYTTARSWSYVVRARQAGVARRLRRTYLVRTDDLEHSPLSRIHLTSKGTIDLGRRFVRTRFGL